LEHFADDWTQWLKPFAAKKIATGGTFEHDSVFSMTQLVICSCLFVVPALIAPSFSVSVQFYFVSFSYSWTLVRPSYFIPTHQATSVVCGGRHLGFIFHVYCIWCYFMFWRVILPVVHICYTVHIHLLFFIFCSLFRTLFCLSFFLCDSRCLVRFEEGPHVVWPSSFLALITPNALVC
jgi:hypothetical protein